MNVFVSSRQNINRSRNSVKILLYNGIALVRPESSSWLLLLHHWFVSERDFHYNNFVLEFYQAI